MSKEIWKLIPDIPNYEVSNLGRVRSWKRCGNSKIDINNTPKVLTTVQHPRTLAKKVSLYIEGVSKVYYIAHLVLMAFIGKRPQGKQCQHVDGDNTNDNPLNLKWSTRSEILSGRHKRLSSYRGVKHHASRQDSRKVRAIRVLITQGLSLRKIAEVHDVSHQTVANIKKGLTYTDVK